MIQEEPRIGDIIEISVPPCGHLYCDGFMGCIYKVRAELHNIIEDPGPIFRPGIKIRVRQVHVTGFAKIDWEIINDSSKA